MVELAEIKSSVTKLKTSLDYVHAEVKDMKSDMTTTHQRTGKVAASIAATKTKLGSINLGMKWQSWPLRLINKRISLETLT